MRVRLCLSLAAAFLAAVSSTGHSGEMEEVVVRGQDVVIIEAPERTIYEYRRAGMLRMVKIVPRRGKPYYLVPRDPTRGGGDLESSGTLIPSWRIVEF
ncbi:MAG: DUF2782 domain-containing protein [Gammaproteobacteria bacterium]|jgi:hypothetical protein